MNKKRLLKLADFLENKISARRFDLGHFADGELNTCGTTACALGWATAIPSFNKNGLVLSREQHWASYFATEPTFYYSVEFNGKQNFDAAAKFFNISLNHSFYLFDPSYYGETKQNKAEVVKRIRNFVANNGISKNSKWCAHLNK